MDGENEILKNAVDCFGEDHQTDMMIEEMSELTKALLKYRRNVGEEDTGSLIENIIEEMADVEIMLGQMKIIYGDCDAYRSEKLVRLAAMLLEAKEKKE